MDYEFTNDTLDFVPSYNIETWIKKEGSMTYKNFVIQQTQYCEIDKFENIGNKS